jgi:hypothetical protein
MKSPEQKFRTFPLNATFSAFMIPAALVSAAALAWPGLASAGDMPSTPVKLQLAQGAVLMAKATYKVTVMARSKNGGTTRSTEIVDAGSESEAAAKAVERVQRRYPDNSVWADKVEMQ